MNAGNLDLMIIDNLEIGIVILDDAARIVHINRWFSRHSGLAIEQTLGQALLQIIPEATNTRLEHAIQHAIVHHLPSLLSPALHGSLLPLYQTPRQRQRDQRMQQMIHVMPLHAARHNAACLIQISDVTANISRERLLRQQTEVLRRNTTHDALTGVANRRKFDETLDSEFKKAQLGHSPLALLLVDLDQFSAYNQHYGRERGDAALLEIAGLLHDAVRPASDLVARYAGDKLALILPGMEEQEASRFAEALRQRIAALAIPGAAPEIAPHLTVSIGATAVRPGNDADTHTLLSSADVALYQAKHDGRNRAVMFSPNNGNFITCS